MINIYFFPFLIMNLIFNWHIVNNFRRSKGLSNHDKKLFFRHLLNDKFYLYLWCVRI